MDGGLDELGDEAGPVLDPLGLAGHGNGGVGALPSKGPHLVGADALDQPDGSGGGDVLGEAVIQQGTAAHAVGDRSTQATQGDGGIGQVTQPGFPLGVGQGDAGGQLEGGGTGDPAEGLLLSHGGSNGGRKERQAGLMLQQGPQDRSGRLMLSLGGWCLFKEALLDRLFRQHVLGPSSEARKEVGVACRRPRSSTTPLAPGRGMGDRTYPRRGDVGPRMVVRAHTT